MTPLEIIKECEKKYKVKKFIGMFSGGKDSLVASHAVSKLGLLDRILYLNTGIGCSENFQYVKKTCEENGWKMDIESPTERFCYDEFVKRFGFPHSGLHSPVMGYLKWFSIRRYAKNNQGTAFVTGVRQKESKRRMRTHKSTMSSPEKNIVFVNPIFDWTTEQVWGYLKENNLEKCPVYDTLHMSGDCLCGAFSEKGEAELIATFHPDLAQKISDLESKYGKKWGNHTSMSGAKKQTKLEGLVCSECIHQ